MGAVERRHPLGVRPMWVLAPVITVAATDIGRDHAQSGPHGRRGAPSNGADPPHSVSIPKFARVAELADALASGASVRKDVGVQVPSRALRVFQEIEVSFS